MRWEQVCVPRRAALEQRVRQRCPRAADLVGMGRPFGDWVENGRNAPPAYVERVEQRLVADMDTAADVGVRHGVVTGLWTGFGVLVVLLVAGLIALAVR